jgi:hypothetical protein
VAAVPGGEGGFLAITAVAFVILGSVLEGIPAIVLFGPLLFPVAKAMGVHEVHYALVIILAMGIGLVASPVAVIWCRIVLGLLHSKKRKPSRPWPRNHCRKACARSTVCSGAARSIASEETRMKTCPYCLEDVKDAAVKCPHCQSSLQPETETNNRYVRYDIDKGVIHFGKFVVVIMGLLIFIGLAFYAMDLKDALEKAAEAKSAAKIAQMDAEKAQLDTQKAD